MYHAPLSPDGCEPEKAGGDARRRRFLENDAATARGASPQWPGRGARRCSPPFSPSRTLARCSPPGRCSACPDHAGRRLGGRGHVRPRTARSSRAIGACRRGQPRRRRAQWRRRRGGRARRPLGSLPTYAFATQPPHAGGDRRRHGAMITAAIALAAIPAAAIAWIATLTAGLLAYYLGGGHSTPDRLTFLVAAPARSPRRPADALDLRPAQGDRATAHAPNRSGCCSRNMSIAASAGCGRSMPRIGSSTSRRG